MNEEPREPLAWVQISANYSDMDGFFRPPSAIGKESTAHGRQYWSRQAFTIDQLVHRQVKITAKQLLYDELLYRPYPDAPSL